MPPPITSSTRCCAVSRGRLVSLAAASRGSAAANASPSDAAARRMVRISSSTERPCLAARSRSRFLSLSSSWRTVREAMAETRVERAYYSIDCSAINAIKLVIGSISWLWSKRRCYGGSSEGGIAISSAFAAFRSDLCAAHAPFSPLATRRTYCQNPDCSPKLELVPSLVGSIPVDGRRFPRFGHECKHQQETERSDRP